MQTDLVHLHHRDDNGTEALIHAGGMAMSSSNGIDFGGVRGLCSVGSFSFFVNAHLLY